MSNKILIISGPTAAGKTSLAVKLSKIYPCQLISADSRQVYQGLDIGTGKDHPKAVKLHLVDILKPSQSFSVADFQKQALKIISQIHHLGQLPIIVGGTGQYLDSLISPKDTFHIKPKKLLRFFFNPLPTSVLQSILKIVNKNLFLSLNNSDRHNPHRLIRKIEISLSKNQKKFSPPNFDYLHISLTAKNNFLYHRIDSRVQKRLDAGLLTEIKHILKTYSWSDPGLNTLAYKEFKPYFQKKITLSQAIDRWRFDEHAYARRQKTWFAKYTHIHFVDIQKTSSFQQVSTLVSRWYNQL